MKCQWMPLISACVLITYIAGCGGGDDSVITSGGESGDGGVRVGNRGGAAAPAVPAARKQKAVESAVPKIPAKVDSAVATANPHDLFVVANDEPNFAIVTDGANTFYATAPEKGVDSSQFTFTPPADGNSTGNSAARPSANPPAKKIELPEGFTAVEDAGYSEEGYPQSIRCDKDDSLMVLIPSSISPQGTNDGPSNAGPEIAMFLDPYYIDVTEVTLAQYDKFRAWWREEKERTLELPANSNSPDDHPALGITWANARNYTLWAGKQLPTEAEWEKAARGPEGFVHPWGNGRAGWFPTRTLNQIDAVMSFRADISPYGVYDLAGNAREWCDDFYADTAYAEAIRNGETVVRNWMGPKRGRVESHRVVKGNGPDWMVWHRSSANMRETSPQIGFRCVLRGFANEDEEESNDGEKKRRRAGF